jgi:hypothetical protein
MKFTSLTVLGGLVMALTLPTAPAVFAQDDPGVPGPLDVVRAAYDFGDTDQTFGGFPYETRAVVYHPADLSTGPFPMVVFLHGWHPTCYVGSSFFTGEWPCNTPHQPIPSYLGYEYEQQILASYGYIVISVSANGVNAKDTQFFDVGMLWRATVIQHHLDLWNDWNTVGGAPFDDPTMFVGKVDLSKVGTMGHSRGGEGVSRHYTYNRDLGSPYGVRAVLPLAPVNFSREDLNDVNLQVLLPYCDGDVADLQGAHFFDDARYFAGDATNKHYTLVMGGNHSYYNTIWTPGGWPAATWDDWQAFEDPARQDPWCGDLQPGNHKLPPEQVRGTLKAYATGFFRIYLGDETAFLPILRGDAPPPPSATTTEIFSTYHAKEVARLDVNRNVSGGDGGLATNTLGGAVTQNGLDPYDKCGGEAPEPQHCLPTPPHPTKRQPHTTPSARSPRRGLSQVRLGWNDPTASLTNEIPGGRDVSSYAVIQFRAVVNFDDLRNVGPQDLSVVLTDGQGNSSSQRVSTSSGALFFPPGFVGPPNRAVPKIVQNTVRIPLSAFSGVDLTNIVSVTLNCDQTPEGALILSDLAFSD